MTVYSLSTETDNGTYEVIGETGVAEANTAPLDAALDDYAYIRMPTFNGSFDELGRPIDPPTFTSLVLTVESATLNALAVGTLSVHHLPVFAPLTGIDPTPLATDLKYHDIVTSANLLGTATVGAQLVGTQTSVTLDLDNIFPVYRNGDYRGFISVFLSYALTAGDPFTVTLLGGVTGSTDAPIFTSVEVPFITGKSGLDGKWSRVVRCGKCGFLRAKEDLLLDGWFKGLWVCPECWDPEEPPRVAIPPDAKPIND